MERRGDGGEVGVEAATAVDWQTRMWRVAAPVSPVFAVGLGLWWMRAHGVAGAVMGMQTAALGLGGAAFVGLQRAPVSRLKRALPWCALGFVGLLASTFVAAGMEGVHRWVALGPMRLHASALLAPAALVAIALLLSRSRLVPVIGIVVAAQLVHVLQPDAGSATALAAGVIGTLASWVFAGKPALREKLVGGGIALAGIAGAVIAWRRADPLLPVPHVEGIVELAASHGAAAYAAAIAALVLVPQVVGGLALRRQAPAVARMAAAGIAMHLAAAMMAARFGAFPVPLLGFGAAPVLGTYLGLGLTAALARGDEVVG